MGNAAVDWDSVPVKYPQFDPDQPDYDEIRRQQEGQFIDDWCDDSLAVEMIYQVCHAMAEEHSDLFQAMQAAYRSGDHDALNAESDRFVRAMQEIIKDKFKEAA